MNAIRIKLGSPEDDPLYVAPEKVPWHLSGKARRAQLLLQRL